MEDVIKNKTNSNPARSGIEYLDGELRRTALVVHAGFGQTKSLWVLDLLTNKHNQDSHEFFHASSRPGLLFALAWKLLCLACQASMEQAKAFPGIRWYRKQQSQYSVLNGQE